MSVPVILEECGLSADRVRELNGVTIPTTSGIEALWRVRSSRPYSHFAGPAPRVVKRWKSTRHDVGDVIVEVRG